MDRPLIEVGELPCAEDFLGLAKETLFGLAYLAQATIGNNTGVNGFAISPTGPASLSFNIGAGSIYALETADATAYGVLGTDSTSIFKQGILSAPVTLTVTPPATSGFSQVYLVQVAYSDVDGGAALVPFFNSLDPTHPSSSTQNTVRFGQAVVQLKAGTAASTGSQTTPPPDAGFTALWAITVANGATTVTSANWVQLSVSGSPYGAPWFPSLESLFSLFLQLAPTTAFFVNGSTGSDSLYDGTSATVVSGTTRGPWATIQHAVNAISVFSSSSTITVNIAGGTYSGFTVNPSTIAAWTFSGAGSGSTTILAATGAVNGGVAAQSFNSNMIVTGATLRGSAGCIGWQGSGATGYCSSCVIDGSLSPTAGIGYNSSASGTIQGANTFSSGAGSFSACVSVGQGSSVAYGLTANPAVTTLLGSIVNANTFISVAQGASVTCAPSAMSFIVSGGSGTSGAKRFAVSGGGGITANGGGATLFPGGVVGATTSPGYYYN